MKTKFYELTDGSYLVVTSTGNFKVRGTHIEKTSEQPQESSKEFTPDLVIASVVDNAISNAKNILTEGEVRIFQTLVQDSIEDAVNE